MYRSVPLTSLTWPGVPPKRPTRICSGLKMLEREKERKDTERKDTERGEERRVEKRRGEKIRGKDGEGVRKNEEKKRKRERKSTHVTPTLRSSKTNPEMSEKDSRKDSPQSLPTPKRDDG